VAVIWISSSRMEVFMLVLSAIEFGLLGKSPRGLIAYRKVHLLHKNDLVLEVGHFLKLTQVNATISKFQLLQKTTAYTIAKFGVSVIQLAIDF